jgi:hypothetical protein
VFVSFVVVVYNDESHFDSPRVYHWSTQSAAFFLLCIVNTYPSHCNNWFKSPAKLGGVVGLPHMGTPMQTFQRWSGSLM